MIIVDANWLQLRGLRFEFLCMARHRARPDSIWLECYGGKRGHEAIMSFPPESVRKA